MLRPKTPAEKIKDDFSVLDIENLPTGEVIAIGHSWRENGIINHRVFSNWEDWWVWLIGQADQSTKFRTIYAHNGGGWDWLSWLQWFIACKNYYHDGIQVGLIEAQSKLVFLDLGFMRKDERNEDGTRKRMTIRLCDSMYLLRSNLDSLAKAILGRGKSESDIEDVWRAWKEDKPRFYKYLRDDCDLLLEVLEKSLDLIREKIAKIARLGITIGGCAMNIYRTIPNGLKKPIFTNMEKSVEKLCREGYHGGRVEVFKHGYFPAINVYDINSLYPAAMLGTRVPITGRGAWSTNFRPDLCGCYRIRFNQNRRDIPPVLLGKGGNGAYESEGVFYTPEISLFKKIDPRGKCEIVEGFVFMESAFIFHEYVTRLYALRLEDKKSAISLLAKFLLNSLYGKWGQKNERKKLVVFDSAEEAYLADIEAASLGKKLEPLERDSLLYAETEEIDVEHAHVGIAGMITSKARAILYETILRADPRTVVYCDTDSIHTTGKLLDALISDELGALKLEAAGEGVYCGKKLYAIREGDKCKVRAKGISVGGKHGFDLTFDHLISLLNPGATVSTSFARPATFRGVLAGDQSCRLDSRNRKRVIRKT